MVNIFGMTDSKAGERGPPGPAGVGRGIQDVIQWFPDMICEQIRKKLNALTLLIESIPPANEPDVELSSEKAVNKWKSFNDREHDILTPVNQGKGGSLKKLSLEMNPQKRYGLVFDKKQETMYHMKNCRHIFLSNVELGVLLTLTFLVGVKDDDSEEEEFIVSDYHWTKWDKSAEKFRGISIIPKPDGTFDLYLKGAVGEDGGNSLKIGHNLKKKLFYTLQVFWNYRLDSFYVLYKDGKTLINKTLFQHNTAAASIIRPAFYLGGFNASTKEKGGVVKSKCYTGIVSNLEIVNTVNPSIPEELLRLIVRTQTVINHDWSQVLFTNDQLMEAFYSNTEEENSEPPAAKRMKFI